MIHTKQGRVLVQGVYDLDGFKRVQAVRQSLGWQMLCLMVAAHEMRCAREIREAKERRVLPKMVQVQS